MPPPKDQPPLIQVPASQSEWPRWREELVAWRKAARQGYNADTYLDPAFAWTQTCYCCTKIMTWDERFLDHATGEYHVEAIVEDGIRRFGGYDGVVLWHAYPRIGFDDRNQFDYYAELPGGLPGVRKVVERFHEHGMRVFIDYNPWDTGTRRPGMTDAEACAKLVAEIGGDGIFLDTLGEGAGSMREACDRAKPGIALESELAMPISALPTNQLSWAQWFDSYEAPGVLRNRWFEQRHMMHFIRRWDTSHASEIQLAWMNGAGMLVWENIFGSWNGWSVADQKLLHGVLRVQRKFGEFFRGGAWTPMVPTAQAGLYANLWEYGPHGKGQRMWTLANRTSEPIRGPLLNEIYIPGARLFDLFTGKELARPEGEIAANGVGGILAVDPEVTDPELLARVRGLGTGDRGTFSAPKLSPKPVKIALRSSPAKAIPENMIEVKPGLRRVVTKFRQRECGERGYAPVGGPHALHAELIETREIEMRHFAVMRRGITNAEFAEFVKAANYRPERTENLLRHFEDGRPRAGEEAHPVRYVNLADARAYAKWKGWRLPTDAEWQVALADAPELLLEHPLWNWTESEYTDGRTRYAILKGGAEWKATGSGWYADSGIHPPDFAAKFIEIWAGLDRCATVGFRCAVDISPSG